MSDEKIAALVDLQNAAQRAAHKANPVEIQVALQQVLGEEFFVEQFFRYVQDMLLPARDEIIARAEAALAAAEAERDAAVARADRAEDAAENARHYHESKLHSELDDVCGQLEAAEARCVQYEQALREIEFFPFDVGHTPDRDLREMREIAHRALAEHDHELHCAYANGASAVCNCGANLAAGEETP